MYHTIQTAAAAIQQRSATPLDLLDQCLKQIDKYEQKVHAWVFVDRELAREQAERMTAELQAGKYRGPLHGIPIAVKDIVDVFDWPTACGSKLWANSVAREDAPIVKNLRQAGAVLLGKTVTTQFASFDPPVTVNPWNHQRTPGGSSSGSAAAVACGMCLGAVASQTGGSITRPAAYCGVAGCKPSYGRVNAAGLLPLAASMDHPGPIARCVWDLAAMLQVFAGSGMETLTPAELPAPPRLGCFRGLFHDRANPDVRAFMATVEGQLKKRGATLTEVLPPPAFSEVVPRHRTVMAVEAAVFHEPRFNRHPEDYAAQITVLLKEALACSGPEYARCKDHQRLLTQDAANWFEGVDALLTPATTTPAPDKATTGDPAFNSPWSYTGLPTVSLTAGRSPDGMPLSIQLVGKWGTEQQLLSVAAWCEKEVGEGPGEYPVV